MNFKQYFTESEDISKWCEVEDVTDKEGKFYPEEVVKVYSVVRHWKHGGITQYFVTLDKDGVYDVHDDECNRLADYGLDVAPTIKAVKEFEQRREMKNQGLTKQQINTAIKI